jgi:hypothetical protein
MTSVICDKIFCNGKIYTVDRARPWAEAVGIKDDKIAFVGSDVGSAAFADSATEIIDLQGKMMMPGLVEAHSHPLHYLGNVCGVDITEGKDIAEYQAMVGAYAAAHPELAMINGIGWMSQLFENGCPTRQQLDAVVPDRPVCILSADVFHYWVNTKMLELAGINQNTPDIEKGGTIFREADGYPTGYLEEIGGQYLLQSKVQLFKDEDYKKTVKYYQQLENSLGVTSVHDAAIEAPKQTLDAYLSLAKKGELTVRMRKDMLARELPGTPKLDDALDILREEAKRDYRDKVRSFTIKIMLDGVVPTFTAALEEEYSNRPGFYGELLYDPEELKEFCRRVDAEGYQLRIHAIGDRAIRVGVDAIAYATDCNGPRDARHTMCHLNMTTVEQMERMKKYHIIADLNPYWHTGGIIKTVLPFLGEQRTAGYRRFHSFIDHGVLVETSSDAPVTAFVLPDAHPHSPFVAVQIGMTRCNIGEDPMDMANVHAPQERSSLEEMLRSVTIDAAYSMFTDGVSGSIEVGKYADLILLDQNLFEIPVTDIYRTKVLWTLFEGKEVYRAG